MDASSPTSTTPAQFVASHGDPSTWSAPDFEVHQHLAEVAQFEAELLAQHCVAPSSAPLATA